MAKPQIVKFKHDKYGVRLPGGKYADISGDGYLWDVTTNPKYCLGTLKQAEEVIAIYADPVVVTNLDEAKPKPAEKAKVNFNIDRHDIYFFLVTQVVIIVCAGAYLESAKESDRTVSGQIRQLLGKALGAKL